MLGIPAPYEYISQCILISSSFTQLADSEAKSRRGGSSLHKRPHLTTVLKCTGLWVINSMLNVSTGAGHVNVRPFNLVI